MTELYLLAFIAQGTELPEISGFDLHLTQSENYGVLWTPSPIAQFKTKADFLSAVLKLYTELCAEHQTVLPISFGTRVYELHHIPQLLRTYHEPLDTCMHQIKGCCEYCLTFNSSDVFPALTRFNAISTEEAGKVYFQKLRRQYELEKKTNLIFEQSVIELLNVLKPWIVNVSTEKANSKNPLNEIALLVRYEQAKDFQTQIKTYLTNQIQWSCFTGPWPPFHFSTFSFKSDPFLIHKTLNW